MGIPFNSKKHGAIPKLTVPPNFVCFKLFCFARSLSENIPTKSFLMASRLYYAFYFACGFLGLNSNVVRSVSTRVLVYFLMYLLNYKSLDHETWPTYRYDH